MLNEDSWTEYLNQDDPAIMETQRVFDSDSAFPQAPKEKEADGSQQQQKKAA